MQQAASVQTLPPDDDFVYNQPSTSRRRQSTSEELAIAFPGMHRSRPSPYFRPGGNSTRRYTYVPRPPKNFLKRVVLVGPECSSVPKEKFDRNYTAEVAFVMF